MENETTIRIQCGDEDPEEAREAVSQREHSCVREGAYGHFRSELIASR